MARITQKSLNDLKAQLSKEYEVKLNKLNETFTQKFVDMEKACNDVMVVHNRTLESLNLITTNKDIKINKLQKELNDLKETLKSVSINEEESIELKADVESTKEAVSFLTQETTDLNQKIVDNTLKIKETVVHCQDIENKTVDLEDRSRRNNLVFFNIEEESVNYTKRENCEQKIISELVSCGMVNQNQPVYIARCHRLGKKGSGKARPIIACFSDFKQKEFIIKNAKFFNHRKVNVSEDYSRQTLAIHRKLAEHGKSVKEQHEYIIHFRIQYRRLVLTYLNKKSDKTFVRSFTLKNINEYSNWFVPRSDIADLKQSYNNDSV